MTPRNFPPADQCEPEDLDAIADLVVRDPSASWDLAGSREHIEALCRRYQALVQDLSAAAAIALERDRLRDQHDADRRAIAALERDLARATNHLDEAQQEIAYLKTRIDHQDKSRAALGDLAFDLLADLDSSSTEIRALAGTLDAERNERQAEVLQSAEDRERADKAEVRAEQMRHQLEAMAALLDEQRQTRDLDDQLRSTYRTITGKDLGEVDIQLDEELAANPDAGPLHHARDQRDQRDHQEDTTP